MSESESGSLIESVADLTPKNKPFKKEWFEYPLYSFFRKEGNWDYGPVFRDPVSNLSPKEMLDPATFETVYYQEPGRNDGEAWVFLVLTTRGYYIYFEASCDFTGFDCKGGVKIIYSKDPEKMWNFGLTDSMREELEENDDYDESSSESSSDHTYGPW